MAKTTTNPFTQTIRNFGVALVNATSFTATQPGTAPSNTVLLCTSGADGSVLKQLSLNTDATVAAQTVGIWWSRDGGTTKYLLGVINVPLNAGYTGAVINVDGLANSFLTGLPTDQSGRPVFPMEATTGGVTCSIYVGCLLTAVAANKTLWVTAVVEDY